MIPGLLQNIVSEVESKLFPINTITVQEITLRQQKSEPLSVNCLIDIIKTDIGLLLHCLRQAAKGNVAERSIIGCLSSAGRDSLLNFIDALAEEQCVVSLSNLPDEQMQLLAKSSIAISVMELLAERQDYDSAEGFSFAFRRRLGLLLAAWHYPSTYHSAYTRVGDRDTEALSSEIQKRIGFSPDALHHAILELWGLESANKEVEEEIFDKPSLAYLYQLSERFAYSSYYLEEGPCELQQVLKDVLAVIGEDQLELLVERLRKYLLGYQHAHPKFFNKFNSGQLASTLLNDKYTLPMEVIECGGETGRALRELYSGLASYWSPSDCLNFVIKGIMPTTTFSGFCIFSLDEATQQLLPKTKLGVCHGVEIVPFRISSSDEKDSILYQAFNGEHIQKEIPSTRVTSFAAPLSTHVNAGVIYFEVLGTKATGHEERCFYAISRALEDILVTKN